MLSFRVINFGKTRARSVFELCHFFLDASRASVDTCVDVVSVSTVLGAIGNFWENAPARETAYNLVVCSPIATKLKI